MRAYLALEDGTVYQGTAFGATGETTGEVVFNTGMTGYQEVLTDPSYAGQIVTMTYPLIGNYGIAEEDYESDRPHVAGFVVREHCRHPSNWRSRESLDEFLERHGILGIEGIDTRALTRRLRVWGVMRGVLSTTCDDPEELVRRARAVPPMTGQDLVQTVTTSRRYSFKPDLETPMSWCHAETAPTEDQLALDFSLPQAAPEEERYHVVLIDCGYKRNIARQLWYHGCEVTVVPAFASAEEILALNPDGVLISNGPGDPAAVTYVIETVRRLIGKTPLFGICLGHQLLALALGGTTFKLKFGHRGANQPVKRLDTGQVEITSQNHGFCVDIDSLRHTNVEVTHINLNDDTVEGIAHRDYPAFSVQYHPEAAPGPHDASYLFQRFVEMMRHGA